MSLIHSPCLQVRKPDPEGMSKSLYTFKQTVLTTKNVLENMPFLYLVHIWSLKSQKTLVTQQAKASGGSRGPKRMEEAFPSPQVSFQGCFPHP